MSAIARKSLDSRSSLLRSTSLGGMIIFITHAIIQQWLLGSLFVLSFIVIPLSAAPPLPAPTLPQFLEIMIEHILVIGLPLGIIVRRNANIKI